MNSRAFLICSLILCLLFTGCTTLFAGGNGGEENLTKPGFPKEIKSKDIVEFYAAFDTREMIASEQKEGALPRGLYKISLKKAEDGALCTFSCSDKFDVKFKTNKQALVDLQTFVDAHHMSQLNGYYSRKSTPAGDTDLSIVYASGEKITAGTSGGAQLPSPYWDVKGLQDFFKELAAKNGQKINL